MHAHMFYITCRHLLLDYIGVNKKLHALMLISHPLKDCGQHMIVSDVNNASV